MSKYQKYGNVKMRGKNTKLLRCGCCVAINKKSLPRATEEDLQKLEKSAKIYKPGKQYPIIKDE
jgi:hypothetical protein